MRLGRMKWLCAAALMLLQGQAQAAQWAGAWASSQMIPEGANVLADSDLTDTTLRQIVRVTAGGERLRVRVSNVFGTAPLRLGGVHVARAVSPRGAAIVPGSDRALTFDGLPEVTIPAGADYVSDPIDLPVTALSSLAVSIRFIEPPARQTSHPGSRTTSYIVKGDSLAAADLPGAKPVERWYFLSAIDVETARPVQSIVTLGDSITDGNGATTNADDRWPDILANKLQASPRTRHLSVLNHGIGGNKLLVDGIGPNALARFDRDVIAQTGVKHLIVLEGVNDLGSLTRLAPVSQAEHDALVARIIGAYRQIITRARAHGIRVIGATIMPYGGSEYYHPDRLNEADRQAVNAWIRKPGNFDAVADFDKATRDPARPDRLSKAYDKGDGLHPTPAGFRAMADAVPMSAFAK